MADSSTRGLASAVFADDEGSVLDDRIEAVADERRRRVLVRAAAADGAVPLEDLVDALVDAGDRTTPLATDPDHVALRLHHVHLPKLDAAGLLAYDPGDQRAASTDAGERFCAVLDEL